MIKRLGNKQLMVLYLGSKSLIEHKTEFDFSGIRQNPRELLDNILTIRAQSKPAIYRRLSSLSRELKARNYTDFQGWYDFSNWENFHHFVIKVYENKAAFLSFSLN